MAENAMRGWALKRAEQRLLEIGEEAAAIYNTSCEGGDVPSGPSPPGSSSVPSSYSSKMKSPTTSGSSSPSSGAPLGFPLPGTVECRHGFQPKPTAQRITTSMTSTCLPSLRWISSWLISWRGFKLSFGPFTSAKP